MSSHIFHFNIPNELLDSKERIKDLRIAKARLSTTIQRTKTNRAINYISSLIYQVHTVDLLLCFLLIPLHKIPASQTRNFKRIFRHSVRKSIPVIDSKRYFKFSYGMVRQRAMIELMLPTLGSKLDMPLLLDIAYVEIPA